MKPGILAGAVALIAVAACGEETPPRPEVPPADEARSADAPDSEDETGSAPGMMPPAPDFVEDGDTLRAAVGETLRLEFPLPDGVGTNHGWAVEGGTYPDWLDYRGTSTSMMGPKRSNEITLMASAPGNEAVQFVMYIDREESDQSRTVTIIAE